MAWVVELNGYDILGASAKTLLFALGQGIAFTDHTYAPSGLVSWTSPSQRIDIGSAGQVVSAADLGEIVIANAPDDITQAGPWDALAGYAWQGRVATLYWVPARVWANRVVSAVGLLQQPFAALVLNGSLQGSLTFGLSDPRAELDTPLQVVKYGGTNVAPNGVDGVADLKGKPRPVLYGVASNIPGVLVNFPKLIWELTDKLATVLCVRDGGVWLAAGTSRANTTSMLANAPTPGTYDYCSTSTGTYVRLGSTPVFKPAFDVQEGALSSDRTHAQVWKRIRTERCLTAGGSIVGASVTATDVVDPNEVGFWFDAEITRRVAIDQVLASLSGYEVQDLTGAWSLGKLVAPTATPTLGLVMVTESSAMKLTDRPLVSLQRAQPSYAPNGAPPYQVNVRWGQNYTVMVPADFAGATDQRLKDKFASQWRVETASSATTWDPVANTGYFRNAPALTIDTGYQPGVDGLTCPHAVTYAAERLALYGALLGQYQVSFLPEPGDAILPGSVVSMSFPGHGLSGGPKFVVLQASWRVAARLAEANLVLGFQT